MASPQERYRDPQPLGRDAEIALVVFCGVLVVLSLAALTGLGVASALAGGGWVWPTGGDTIGQVLAGLLSGLSADQVRRSSGHSCVFPVKAQHQAGAHLDTSGSGGYLTQRRLTSCRADSSTQ